MGLFHSERVAKEKLGATIYGEQFVTPLARSYGLMEYLIATMLKKVEGCFLLPQSFMDARIVWNLREGKYSVPLDDPI